MDSSPRLMQSDRHPWGGHALRARLSRALTIGLFAVALAGIATFADQQGGGNVAAAPGDGFAKPNPQGGVILENHVVSIPVAFTTCANAASEVCRIGAYDLTLNYNDPIFDVVTDGAIATSATSTSITSATAAWKIDQWKGSQVHITSGPGFNQKRTVVSNTATTITVASPWNPLPAAQPTSGSIFNVGGMAEGNFIGSTGRPVNCQAAEYGATWAELICITLGAEPQGPSGTGNLTNLTVRAVGRGLSSLTLTEVQILEIDGDPIPIDVFNGNRRVILCPDPNGDGRITSIDLGQIAQQFGKSEGQLGYTETRDPNEDNVISSIDLGLTAQVFSKRCVQP